MGIHLCVFPTKTNMPTVTSFILLFLSFIFTSNLHHVECFPESSSGESKSEKSSSGLPFSEKFSQLNIKEPRSSLEDINQSKSDFPNVKSHFRDIPKDESGTKSGVMPNWTIKMPSLK